MAVVNKYNIDTNQFRAESQTNSTAIMGIGMSMAIASGKIIALGNKIKGVPIFETQAKRIIEIDSKVQAAFQSSGGYQFLVGYVQGLYKPEYAVIMSLFEEFNSIAAQVFAKINSASQYIDSAIVGNVLLKADERVKQLPKLIALAASPTEETNLKNELSAYEFARSLGDNNAEVYLSQITLNKYAPEILNPPPPPVVVAPVAPIAPTTVAPTTVQEAVASAPVVTVNPANGVVSKVETKEITPGLSVPTFTPVAQVPMAVLESKSAGAVASEINANVKNIIAENTASSTNTATNTVPTVESAAASSPTIPMSMGMSSANFPQPQMQMSATSTNAGSSTTPEGEEVKPLWKQMWEKYKLWIIVGAVIVVGLLAFWIWYMIDSDKDREEARVQKLKLKLKKQEGQLEEN